VLRLVSLVLDTLMLPFAVLCLTAPQRPFRVDPRHHPMAGEIQ
jgi:hypothetical protein